MNLNSPLPIVLADCSEHVVVERAIWEIATRLPAHRFDVRVWLGSDPAKQPLADALERAGVTVDRLPTAASGWSWKSAFDTWLALRRTRPALLHMHFAWPARDTLSRAVTSMSGVRHHIVSVHGGRTQDLSIDADRTVMERADFVTTTCEVFVEQLIRETGLPRDRFRRVPTGVDPEIEDVEHHIAHHWREKLGAGLLRPLWVCPGRWDAHRGTPVFIEALGIVQQRGLPFVAAIAGGGPQRSALESRLEELGLSKVVRILDDVDDPGPLLLAADVVAIPSLWDSLPGLLLQAMVRQRPIVASAVGGVPDVIEHGESGRLVPPGDATALADALESFHRRPEGAERMGRQARQHALDELAWERVVAGYETVYDEALGLASFQPESQAVSRGRW